MIKLIEVFIESFIEGLIMSALSCFGVPEPPKPVKKVLKFIIGVLYVLFIVFLLLITWAAFSEGDTGWGIFALIVTSSLIVMTIIKISKNKKNK